MKTLKLVLAHEDWKVNLLSNEEYVAKHDDTSLAITLTTDKVIDFNESTLIYSTIAHELFHVYFSQTLVQDCNMTQDDAEELSANVMGKYIDEFYSNYMKLRIWSKI